MASTPLRSQTFRNAFILVLVLAISALTFAVAWPFLEPLLLGALLAGLFHPFYRWLARKFGGRKSLAATTALVLLLLVITGPLAGFLGIVIAQAVEVSDRAIPWVREQFGASHGLNMHDWLVGHFPSLATYIPSEGKIIEYLGQAANASGRALVTAASRMTAGTAGLLLDAFVMFYAMFFFLRDGPSILEKVFYYLPLNHDDEVRMLQRFSSITRATIKGTLIIGLLQGFLAGIAFWAAGINGAAFWGTIMVVLAIIPGIGAPLVWIPGVIYLYVTGHPLAATLLAIWCAAVVGSIDNILRPILVGADAQMPDLLILVGTLGGLALFGPIGFITGPIVCGLFLTVWDIYGVAFAGSLPPVGDLRAEEIIAPEPPVPPTPPPALVEAAPVPPVVEVAPPR